MEKVRLGIIGVGNMGSSHIRNYLKNEMPEFIITAVCDIKEDRLEWAKEQLPDVKTFNDASALMDSGEVDAILIATPHYFHPPMVIEGLNKGLHVMSEKPAGVYTKQVREMNEVAKKSNKIFGIMFNQRTNCLYRKAHEIVHSGKYGELKRVTWIITDWYRTQAYYNSGGWRATWSGEGGGVLLNQCPHQLDLWQWICGMPEKITAVCHEGKWHDIEVEDDVTAYLEYKNGATGVFITTTGDAPGTNRLEVTGTKGTLICDSQTLEFVKLKVDEREHCVTSKEGFAKPEKDGRVTVETDGENPQHIGVLRAFGDKILGKGELIAEGHEGINGLTLSNAMHLSSWTDKKITLPIDEDAFYVELEKRIKTSRKKEGKSVTLNTEGSY